MEGGGRLAVTVFRSRLTRFLRGWLCIQVQPLIFLIIEPETNPLPKADLLAKSCEWIRLPNPTASW